MPYKNPADERARSRRKYWKNVEKSRLAGKLFARKYYAQKKDDPLFRIKARQQARESYARHRETRKAGVKRYYQANRELCDSKKRVYYERNPEVRKKARLRWSQRNKAKLAAKEHRRRMRAEAHTDGTAEAFYVFIRSKEWVKCYYCGSRISGKEAHIDHVIALSKNGNHASQNLCASCPKCNLKKNDRLPSEITFIDQPLLNL